MKVPKGIASMDISEMCYHQVKPKNSSFAMLADYLLI